MSKHTKLPAQVYKRGEICGPYILALVFDPLRYGGDIRGGMTVACGEPNPRAGLYWPAEGVGGISEETQRDNAALIAEAFNTATQTGLTPKQLAEQRAELLNACDAAPVVRLDDTIESFRERYQEWHSGQRLAAIAKAEGGAS